MIGGKLALTRRKIAQEVHDQELHDDAHELDAMAPKRTRPDTRSGRAALTDAGVDGGARADRNYQA